MTRRLVRLRNRLTGGVADPREILRGGLGTLITKVGSIVAAIGLTVVLSRALGPEEFGKFAHLYSIALVVAMLALAGLPSLITREIARAQSEEDWPRFRGFWRWSIGFVTVTGTLALVATLLLFDQVLTGYAQNTQTFTVATAALIFALVILRAFRHLLQGMRHVVSGPFLDLVFRPAATALLVGLAALSLPDFPLQAHWALSVHALAGLVAALLAIALALAKRPAGARARGRPRYRSRAWFVSCLTLAFTTNMQIIHSQADVVILGLLSVPADVGIYRVAVQSAIPVSLGLEVANLVLAPHFARLHTLDDRAQLQRVVTLGARFAASLAVPAAVVMITLGGPIISLVFGDSYRDAAAPLAILVAGQLTSVLCGVVMMLLYMTGQERVAAVSAFIAAVFNIVGNLVLIPAYGMIGAALATTAANVVVNLFLLVAVWSRLRIDTTPLGLKLTARLPD